MPVSTVFVLAGIVAMFAVFAGALAWAQLQTRNISRCPHERARPARRRSVPL